MLSSVARLLGEWYALDATVEEVDARFPGERRTLVGTTREGCVAIKVASGRRDRENLMRAARVLEHLAKNDFPAPRLIRTSEGNVCLADGDRLLLVTEWVTGTRPAATPATFAKLGRLLAHLHRIPDIDVISPVTVDGVLAEAPRLAELVPVAERLRFVAAAERIREVASLPSRLIHFEPTLGNCIETPGGDLILVDWDESGMGPAVIDLGANLIVSMVGEDLTFDAAGCGSLFAAYRAERELSAAEEGALFAGGLLHALRAVAWGDSQRRWRRLLWALERENAIGLATRSTA